MNSETKGRGRNPDAGTTRRERQFEQLLAEFGPWLERTVRSQCPLHLGIDPDEVYQQAVLRLWKAIESEKEILKPSSYLYRVVSSVIIDAIRVTRRRAETSLERDEASETYTSTQEMIEPQPGPYRLASGTQTRAAIDDALQRLSENRRRAVSLHLHGFTTPESARLLGWSEAKVRNLAWRGLQDLKNQLESVGFEP